MRAAASSMASGSPSSRGQISATAGAFSSVTAKSGLIAPRPLDEEGRPPRTATACRRGGSGRAIGQRQRRDGYSCSPRSWSGARLVTSTFRPGQAASSSATTGAAGRICSKLSSSEQQVPVSEVVLEAVERRAAAEVADAEAPARCVDGTSAGSVIGASVDEEHAVRELVEQRRPPRAGRDASSPSPAGRSA